MIETLVPLKKACGSEVWDDAVAECYREVLMMLIRNSKVRSQQPPSHRQTAEPALAQTVPVQVTDAEAYPVEGQYPAAHATQATYPLTVQATYPDAVAQATYPDAVAQATYPDAVAQATYPEAVAQATYPAEDVHVDAYAEAYPAQTTEGAGETSFAVDQTSSAVEQLASPALVDQHAESAQVATGFASPAVHDSLHPMRQHLAAHDATIVDPSAPAVGAITPASGTEIRQHGDSEPSSDSKANVEASSVDGPISIGSVHAVQPQPQQPVGGVQELPACKTADEELAASQDFFAKQDQILNRIQMVSALPLVNVSLYNCEPNTLLSFGAK